jgi:8-oxo-dGTP pyrophosphatase MutT (NUDIX family)
MNWLDRSDNILENITLAVSKASVKSDAVISDLNLRKASVLIPLILDQDEWQLLYIRRTEYVHDHKGQVSFPGGAAENEDQTEVSAALRETWEEIGVDPKNVTILGQMAKYPTVSGYLVTPVLGLIPWPYSISLEPLEVFRLFSVPLRWLADPDHHQEKPFIRQDGKEEKIIYFNSYENEIIWGITARITLDFISML